MIHLWSQRREADEVRRQGPRLSPAQMRAQKDLAELDLPPTIEIHFPDPADVLHFELRLRPDEGMYAGGTFRFDITLNSNYPHDPPRVQCLQRIYHPNLDLEGHVCLNILREDWNPILNLNSVLVGLLFLFLAPNPEDPLNKAFRRDKAAFAADVKRTLRGSELRGIVYDAVL